MMYSLLCKQQRNWAQVQIDGWLAMGSKCEQFSTATLLSVSELRFSMSETKQSSNIIQHQLEL